MYEIFYVRKERGIYPSPSRYDHYESGGNPFKNEDELKKDINRIKDEFDNVIALFIINKEDKTITTKFGDEKLSDWYCKERGLTMLKEGRI